MDKVDKEVLTSYIVVGVSLIFITAVIVYNIVASSVKPEVNYETVAKVTKESELKDDMFYIEGLRIGGEIQLEATYAWMKRGTTTIILKDFNYQNNVTGHLAEFDMETGDLKILGAFRIKNPKKLEESYELQSKRVREKP
jgi:hypothetical protein